MRHVQFEHVEAAFDAHLDGGDVLLADAFMSFRDIVRGTCETPG